MNKKRRDSIREIITRLNGCSDDLEDVKSEEDFARDSIPENMQSGDTYCTSEECSDKIDDAISDIQQAVSVLEEI